VSVGIGGHGRRTRIGGIAAIVAISVTIIIAVTQGYG